jgi:hypothetical protein
MAWLAVGCCYANQAQCHAGVAIQDTTVGPFSTAAALEMAAANISRSEAAQAVATAYGLPAPATVHGKDWLQVGVHCLVLNELFLVPWHSHALMGDLVAIFPCDA